MSGDIEDLKSSVSNGKTSIASAITGKGISTSGTASFSTMASNISSIPTGYTKITNTKAEYCSIKNYTFTGNIIYLELGTPRTGGDVWIYLG